MEENEVMTIDVNTDQETVEGKELATININPDRVARYNPIEAGIADLVEKYKDGPKDLSIPANYEECRKALAKTRGIRGKTEKLRKELKADALAYGKLVDSTAKRIIEKVQEIEAPYAEAKKEYDTRVEIEKREKALAEERRVDGIATKIATISALVEKNIYSSSEVIKKDLQELEYTNDAMIKEWAMEFFDKAKETTLEAMAKLTELHAMKLQQEQAAAEKARAEKEAAEKAEAERVQREKEAAEERERLAKEREALEAERAKLQAEKDKIAAMQAERDRVAREEQAEKYRIAKAEQDEKDRIAKAEQDEKDRIAAEEKAKMAAEIEALKKVQELATPRPLPQPEPEQPKPQPESKGCAQDYKDAGNAILAVVGDKKTAKTLLDKIINGEVPNITYTGAVS